MKRGAWIAIAILGLLAVRALRSKGDAEPIRIATFNIEYFPKDRHQIDGAFDEIAALDAPIVAVQEITDPKLFLATAHARLGAVWDFVHDEEDWGDGRETLRSGVLFDRGAYALVSRAVHDETRLDGRNKGVLEVRLRPATDPGAIIRVLVVHLKCCADGRAIRSRQHAALRTIVAGATRSGDRVVVLGDFNATDDDGDRVDLAELAAHVGLVWATEGVACSAFWLREDGCWRSRLDHVLTWNAPARVEVAGACATEGCERQDRCPLYRDRISDHCPVIVTVP